MAVKWTKQTRSKNLVKEKIRKMISDKVHFRPTVHGLDMKRVIVAKTKRRK
jgi:hypothetical protein